MKQRIMAFFYGRNGMDTLAKVIFYPALILMCVSMFVPNRWAQTILYYISLFAVLYVYFRCMSRNIYARQAENRKFTGKFDLIRLRFQQRKTHRFYHCPKCKAVLRVPKGRGKITITCNKCGEQFVKKT